MTNEQIGFCVYMVWLVVHAMSTAITSTWRQKDDDDNDNDDDIVKTLPPHW